MRRVAFFDDVVCVRPTLTGLSEPNPTVCVNIAFDKGPIRKQECLITIASLLSLLLTFPADYFVNFLAFGL